MCSFLKKNRAFFSIFWWFWATILLSIMFINEKCKKFQLISRIFHMLWNLPGPFTNFYLANGAKLSEVLILLHKMETWIWNKTRIWNTFANDHLVFHIRVYTVSHRSKFLVKSWASDAFKYLRNNSTIWWNEMAIGDRSRGHWYILCQPIKAVHGIEIQAKWKF